VRGTPKAPFIQTPPTMGGESRGGTFCGVGSGRETIRKRSYGREVEIQPKSPKERDPTETPEGVQTLDNDGRGLNQDLFYQSLCKLGKSRT